MSIAMLAKRWRRMSVKSHRGQREIDELDEREWRGYAADAVDKAVAAQDGGTVEWPEPHAAQRDRNQSRNDKGVVDHGGQDGRMRIVETHHVQHRELRIATGAP